VNIEDGFAVMSSMRNSNKVVGISVAEELVLQAA